MRFRDDRLKTGRLLAKFRDEPTGESRGLLFLVSGAASIEPLVRLEKTCRQIIEEQSLTGFEWFDVPDAADLLAVDLRLDPLAVERVEIDALATCTEAVMAEVFGDALMRLARFETRLFPRAGDAVGSIAHGIQFFGRTKELEALKGYIERRQSVLLVAPRRTGKSSLLTRLAEEMGPGTVFLLAEGKGTPEGFVDALRARLSRPTGTPDAEGTATWQEQLATCLGHMADARQALLIDELVFLLEEMRGAEVDEARWGHDVEEFLSLLIPKGDSAVPLVLAGSVDFLDFLREHLEEAISRRFEDHWRRLPLSPLDSTPTWLHRLLLGTGFIVDDEDLVWLERNIDFALPFPSLLFLDYLASEARNRGRLQVRDLDECLVSFLDRPDLFREVHEELRRKGASLPGLSAVVKPLLLRLCSEPVSAGDVAASLGRWREKSGDLMMWLLETYPLEKVEEEFRLVSKLFRKWWLRQHAPGSAR